MSVNRVILVGHLGKDPEIRATRDGGEVASLSVATSETWKDKDTGERKEKTEWHRVSVFNEGTINYLKKAAEKGTQVYIEGQLQTRKWQDKDGKDQYTTEIVLSGFDSKLQVLSKGKAKEEDRPTTHTGRVEQSRQDQSNDLTDIPF